MLHDWDVWKNADLIKVEIFFSKEGDLAQIKSFHLVCFFCLLTEIVINYAAKKSNFRQLC